MRIAEIPRGLALGALYLLTGHFTGKASLEGEDEEHLRATIATWQLQQTYAWGIARLLAWSALTIAFTQLVLAVF